jgi:hypothetical protein
MMGWLKAIGRALKWVATNEACRSAALAVAEGVIAKKKAAKK